MGVRTNIRRLLVLPKKVIVFRPRGWYDKWWRMV